MCFRASGQKSREYQWHQCLQWCTNKVTHCWRSKASKVLCPHWQKNIWFQVLQASFQEKSLLLAISKTCTLIIIFKLVPQNNSVVNSLLTIVIDTSHSSIFFLQPPLPILLGLPVTGYLLQYHVYDNTNIIELPASNTSYTLDSVPSGAVYAITVSALSDVGPSKNNPSVYLGEFNWTALSIWVYFPTLWMQLLFHYYFVKWQLLKVLVGSFWIHNHEC